MGRGGSGPIGRLGFAVWLAVRGLSTARGEAVLRAGVGTVAVVVLLIGAALQPTALARSERIAAGQLPVEQRAAATSGVLVAQYDDYFAGNPITVRRVGVVGGVDNTVPDAVAGMTLPGVGEQVVSPAFAAELHASAEFRERYPARVVGTVPDALLLGPRSLVVWVGSAADGLGPDAGWLAHTGTKAAADIAQTLPAEVRFAIPMLLVGFVIPLLALLALLATLGGARRERRLAALRLVGVTDRTAKFSAAMESGLIAWVGTVAGLTIFVAVRAWIAPLVPVEGALWPEDIRLPIATGAVVAVAFPGLSILASWLGLRALTTSPLGVERQSIRVRPRRWPGLVLGLGLIAAVLVVTGVISDTNDQTRTIVIAAGLLMVGLAGSVPLGVLVAARVVVARTGSLPALIACRRIEREPGRATRVAVGLTMLVVMSGPLLMFFPLIADATAPDLRRLAGLVGADTVVVTQGAAEDPESEAAPRSRMWSALAGADHVAAALTLRTVTIGPVTADGRDPGELATVLVADCAELERVAGVDSALGAKGLRPPGAVPPSWREASALYVEELVGPEQLVRQRQVGEPFGGPAASESLSYPVSPELGLLLDGISSSATLLVPAGGVGRQSVLDGFGRTRLTVPRDREALESVRTDLVTRTALPALTVGERDALARRETREFQVITYLAGLLIVLIAALATTVSAFEQLASTAAERRLLHLEGAPACTARRALVLHTLAPLVLGVVPAAAITLILAKAFAQLDQYLAPPVPFTAIAITTVLAVVTPALATTAASRLARPRSLTVLGE